MNTELVTVIPRPRQKLSEFLKEHGLKIKLTENQRTQWGAIFEPPLKKQFWIPAGVTIGSVMNTIDSLEVSQKKAVDALISELHLHKVTDSNGQVIDIPILENDIV